MRYLIIHVDDVGMSYASNQAAIKLLEHGGATSCSVMMPCSWSYDFVKWCADKDFDCGIHLTLTNEWDHNRWRPLSQAKSLLDPEGFMYKTNDEVIAHASDEDVYAEMEAQIQKADQWGMKYTHFDRHMYTMSLKEEWFDKTIELCNRYNTPLNLKEDEMSCLKSYYAFRDLKAIQHSVGFDQGGSLDEKTENLYRNLNSSREGITLITTHAIIDTPEVRQIIPSWKDRYDEYLILSDPGVISHIKKLGFTLIGFRDKKNY